MLLNTRNFNVRFCWRAYWIFLCWDFNFFSLSNFKNYFWRKLITFFKEVWLSTWGKYEKSKMLYEWEQLCSFIPVLKLLILHLGTCPDLKAQLHFPEICIIKACVSVLVWGGFRRAQHTSQFYCIALDLYF